MRATTTILLISIACGLVGSCLEPYHAVVPKTSQNSLVVDGIMAGPEGVTTIRLSRAHGVDLKNESLTEHGASVRIESDDGDSFDLAEGPDGTYTRMSLPATTAHSYRLHINTASNSEYVSDWEPFRATPPIDSVYWTLDDGIVNIRVDTHDPRNETSYYMWRFSETWAYRSAYQSTVTFLNGQVSQRPRNEFIYDCWRTAPSTSLLVSSSTKLTSDFISGFIVNPVPITDERFEILYSIEVEQFALTKGAYDYWAELKKNTENIGTIFGPQPSQLPTNMHSVKNPEEQVIGFFSGCSHPKVRFWIAQQDLPPTRRYLAYSQCVADTLLLKYVPAYRGGDLLIQEVFNGPAFIGYLKSTEFCVDCRLHGGTTVKPDFWP